MPEMSRQERLNPDGTDYKGRTSAQPVYVMQVGENESNRHEVRATDKQEYVRYVANQLRSVANRLELGGPDEVTVEWVDQPIRFAREAILDACRQLKID